MKKKDLRVHSLLTNRDVQWHTGCDMIKRGRFLNLDVGKVTNTTNTRFASSNRSVSNLVDQAYDILAKFRQTYKEKETSTSETLYGRLSAGTHGLTFMHSIVQEAWPILATSNNNELETPLYAAKLKKGKDRMDKYSRLASDL
jgi:hypothetical protein